MAELETRLEDVNRLNQQLEEEVRVFQERVREEREKYNALWRMNCEQLVEYDEVIGVKEEVIAARIVALEAGPCVDGVVAGTHSWEPGPPHAGGGEAVTLPPPLHEPTTVPEPHLAARASARSLSFHGHTRPGTEEGASTGDSVHDTPSSVVHARTTLVEGKGLPYRASGTHEPSLPSLGRNFPVPSTYRKAPPC